MKNPFLTSEPVEALHPSQVIGRIRRAIKAKYPWLAIHDSDDMKEVAKLIGVSRTHLNRVMALREVLSPHAAAKMHLLDIDGLALYLGQAAHRYWCACQHDVNSDVRFRPKDEPQ